MIFGQAIFSLAGVGAVRCDEHRDFALILSSYLYTMNKVVTQKIKPKKRKTK
jgi:hypothetical protein